MRADQEDLDEPREWGELSVATARTLAGRCGGRCGLPHWGYVIRGVLRVEYPDHEEVIAAGDAYYVTPGHLGLDPGDAELVDFGPRRPGGPTASRPAHTTPKRGRTP